MCLFEQGRRDGQRGVLIVENDGGRRKGDSGRGPNSAGVDMILVEDEVDGVGLDDTPQLSKVGRNI
jgi:hypothetical protein